MTISATFGRYVFDLHTMKKSLAPKPYRSLRAAIYEGARLGEEDADAIAHAIMNWAMEHGVTHYTHWFQPMTGLTAQKHDSFFDFEGGLVPIERFSGNQLIQGEPDASSFPSGGMRSTFEARGYTAWDPSSPVFIMKSGDVSFLCIPSVFFTYTGHALDKKTPLLRSERILRDAVSRALKVLAPDSVPTAFGINSTVGCEQEFFLIAEEYYKQRPDLIMAGRTVLGSRPAKHQQMEDHYFGSIKTRVLSFMQEMESRLYELGVPCKTRHNEVAPHQYEMAPVFERANLAADHNMLVMEVIRATAAEYGFAALFHEKPFAGVNGSGKHVNWSISCEALGNLLEPGKEPHRNQLFLYFLVAVVNAVHKRGGVLRSTVATPGNDHRLGANEAPPAIMSVFLGSHLTHLLDQIEKEEDFAPEAVQSIDLGLSQLPSVTVHTTDRNRTSPFAFTGNKFEFRAVGSSQNIAVPVAILNTAVAEALNEMTNELEKLPKDDESQFLRLLKKFSSRARPVRFEGNNYSDDWTKEAEKRGLPNLRNTPEAFSIWQDEETQSFAKSHGLLDEQEIKARFMVRLENYSKTLDIEANLLLRLVDTHVLPAAFAHQKTVGESIAALQAAASVSGGSKANTHINTQMTYLDRIAALISKLAASRDKLEEAIDKAERHEEGEELKEARYFAGTVLPLMDQVREVADDLETLVDASHWTLPGYQELLFLM